MSLSLVLNNALSGLNVNQNALSVLSQNIANANTVGYSKQIVSQSSVNINGAGAGVSLDEVARKVDEYLVAAIQRQNATVAKASLVDDYSGRIQLFLGQPGSQNSIDSYITTFFGDLQSLSQTPNDSTLQQTAVNSGIKLSGQVSLLANQLQELQFQADQDLDSAVDVVNAALRDLAALNANVATNKVAGRSTADLEDRRDIVLNQIAQYINIQPYTKSSGAIHLTTSNGISLLDDSIYELSYIGAGSASAFSNGTAIGAINLYRLDPSGNRFGDPVELVTSGTTDTITSVLTGGKMAGLLEMRDDQIPAIIAQLDELAASIRDGVNAIHNQGSNFPGASSYTGTREINAQDFTNWTGSVRISLLSADGTAISSPYDDEPNGMVPLTLNLETLDAGSGAGNLSMQSIINEINQYYGVPKDKVELGNLNNIQLVSDVTTIPGNAQQLVFDFDLSNYSTSSSQFFVTGVSVVDNLSASMTTTSTIPSVSLASTGTYATTSGSKVVTVTTASSNGLSEGQRVYLSEPGSAVNGIPATALGGFFTITNVTDTTFDIEVAFDATSTGTDDVASMTALTAYQDVPAGEVLRTAGQGLFTADLSANTSATFYDVSVNVAVDDGSGNLELSTITYRINNSQTNLYNKRFAAISATGQGEIISPNSNDPLLTATLVDANGVELPKFSGAYTATRDGYLKITAGSSSYRVSIDSLDSLEIGKPNADPVQAGSNRGFSHFFDLNDFFNSNVPTSTGDTVANSALNLSVASRIRSNPSLFSTGKITQASGTGNYTYERNAGDNSLVQSMSDLGVSLVSFGAAGGLGASTQSFSAYAGQIIGAASTKAASATSELTSAQTLMEGYAQRSSSISGVNLDTELANTVIYQNAYAATARMITIVNTLFDTLLEST